MRANARVKEALTKKVQQIEYSTKILIERNTDWQKIKAFLTDRLNEVQLTKKQEEKLERYQFVYNQLMSGKYTEQEVIDSLCNPKLYNIKQWQAYDDIRCTKELFSTVFVLKKQFELQSEIKIAKAARAQCLAIHDFKNAASFGKVIQSLIALLPDEDDEQSDIFVGHTIEPVFDPSLIGAPPLDMEELKGLLKQINEKHHTRINLDFIEELPEVNEE